MLKNNTKAPNFVVSSTSNEKYSLKDSLGKYVVLYFYPKDDTPGCTTQACDFRDAVERIIASRSTVFGVSLDSVESHKRFAEKNNLQFSLLSDQGGSVSKAYDSLNNFISFKSSKRNTFIIDPEGKIAKIYLSVKPSTHSQMVLNDLNQLQN
jgi:peroxiredoxin Q/BCP